VPLQRLPVLCPVPVLPWVFFSCDMEPFDYESL